MDENNTTETPETPTETPAPVETPPTPAPTPGTAVVKAPVAPYKTHGFWVRVILTLMGLYLAGGFPAPVPTDQIVGAIVAVMTALGFKKG